MNHPCWPDRPAHPQTRSLLILRSADEAGLFRSPCASFSVWSAHEMSPYKVHWLMHIHAFPHMHHPEAAIHGSSSMHSHLAYVHLSHSEYQPPQTAPDHKNHIPQSQTAPPPVPKSGRAAWRTMVYPDLLSSPITVADLPHPTRSDIPENSDTCHKYTVHPTVWPPRSQPAADVKMHMHPPPAPPSRYHHHHGSPLTHGC